MSFQYGIQFLKKLIRGITLIFFCPKPFVPCGTDPSLDLISRIPSSQKEWNPITMLDPSIGMASNNLIYTRNMQYFRPEPFRRIYPSNIFQVVIFILFCMVVYLFCLGNCSVILPKDKHRI